MVWVTDVRKHGMNLSSHSSCFVEEYAVLLRLNIKEVYWEKQGEDNVFFRQVLAVDFRFMLDCIEEGNLCA